MPLFWLSIAFLIGILLASVAHLSAVGWLWLSLVSVLLFILRRFRKRLPKRLTRTLDPLWDTPASSSSPAPYILFGLSFITLILGALRFQDALPLIDGSHIAWYNDRPEIVSVVGVVERDPDGRDAYINLRVEAESIRDVDQVQRMDVQGLVLARVPTDAQVSYGDRVILTGALFTPPENEEFSYKDYLARREIYSYIPYAEVTVLEARQGNSLLQAVYALKAQALALVYRFFPDPEASLLAGILLGVESGIAPDVQQAFRDTGASHVIAISGFNITILAAFFTMLFSRGLGRVRGALLTMIGIGFYTVLVGADAAVVRAAIMGSLALFARQVGRRQEGLNGLAITAAFMAMVNPSVLWDVGFQLSFAATLGLVLYADPFSQAFERFASRYLLEEQVKKVAGPVGEYFLFTLAAQLTTLPVIVYHFERLSLSSLPANIAILPLQPPIMIVGGLAVLAGLVYFPLGQGIAYLTWPFVAYTIRAVEWFARFEGGVLVVGRVSLIAVIGFYLALFAFTLLGRQIKERMPKARLGFQIAGLAVITSLVWQAALSVPDGRMHVILLDVGMGDAVLIQTPGGRFVLIDGGESSTRLSDGLGRWLPLFYRQLDYLVVAAPREEQVAALPRVVERFPPDSVLWAGPPNLSRSSRFLQQTLTDQGIAVLQVEPGQILDMGQGAQLEVLATGKRGAVLLLTWGNFRLLIPSGISFEEMEDLGMGRDIGRVEALLLADQGYAPLNPPEWIVNLQPELVLLSVAAGNYDGLPSAETLELLDGYTLLRTDQNGWMHITTDGTQMWVEVERR